MSPTQKKATEIALGVISLVGLGLAVLVFKVRYKFTIANYRFWVPVIAGSSALVGLALQCVLPPYSWKNAIRHVGLAAVKFAVLLAAIPLFMALSHWVGMILVKGATAVDAGNLPHDIQNKMTGQTSSSWDLPILLVGLFLGFIAFLFTWVATTLPLIMPFFEQL